MTQIYPGLASMCRRSGRCRGHGTCRLYHAIYPSSFRVFFIRSIKRVISKLIQCSIHLSKDRRRCHDERRITEKYQRVKQIPVRSPYSIAHRFNIHFALGDAFLRVSHFSGKCLRLVPQIFDLLCVRLNLCGERLNFIGPIFNGLHSLTYCKIDGLSTAQTNVDTLYARQNGCDNRQQSPSETDPNGIAKRQLTPCCDHDNSDQRGHKHCPSDVKHPSFSMSLPEAFAFIAVCYGMMSLTDHSKREYAKPDGTHSNTVESAFALLKCGIYGTFHDVSRKHLHRYVAEFDFRWNARKIDDGARTALAIRKAGGKRLRYREPVARVVQ